MKFDLVCLVDLDNVKTLGKQNQEKTSMQYSLKCDIFQKSKECNLCWIYFCIFWCIYHKSISFARVCAGGCQGIVVSSQKTDNKSSHLWKNRNLFRTSERSQLTKFRRKFSPRTKWVDGGSWESQRKLFLLKHAVVVTNNMLFKSVCENSMKIIVGNRKWMKFFLKLQ